MRRVSYDFIPTLVESLKGKYAARKATFESVIEKADPALPYAEFKEQLDEVSGELDLLDSDINTLCKGIYERFVTLKQDFQQNKINQAVYLDYLKYLKNLLTETSEKITNVNLHSEEIASELKKYF